MRQCIKCKALPVNGQCMRYNVALILESTAKVIFDHNSKAGKSAIRLMDERADELRNLYPFGSFCPYCKE